MNKNDQAIKSLLDTVENKKKNLGKLKRNPLATNGLFKFNENEWFNINTVSDKETLVKALAFLISRETTYTEACERLGVDGSFSWYGYAVEEWEADFKARIDAINWAEKKKSLEATKKKLNSLVSTEGKTAMEIEAIKDLLLSM